MKTSLSKAVIFIFGVMFLALALQLYFIPHTALQLFSISYSDSAGLSTIRGDLGGLFFSLAIFLLLGLREQQRHWLVVSVAIIGFIILGRVVGILIDGNTAYVLAIITIELVIMAMISVAYRVLKKDDKHTAD